MTTRGRRRKHVRIRRTLLVEKIVPSDHGGSMRGMMVKVVELLLLADDPGRKAKGRESRMTALKKLSENMILLNTQLCPLASLARWE